ncbi:DUF3800 domain-containing protein [Saccharothrix texasensis]|uniref:Uncharacterized protein DUF3800 n=1 Tax=Saccharothrix texasensis TaxID=103734 RepID=A0A3N1HDY9_9PSEU|nr:DUF3800 domain-containing protein [Saccharothrix texasensis]ROP40714.1 uncharacterized protein DUF3800 [Saccharothrix texasensis]
MARRYLFSDESGDLQFRATSQVSRYFAVGTLLIEEPELGELRRALATARDELAWAKHGLDSTFHATTDSQYVRDAVFEALKPIDFRVDVTLIDKPKAQPKIRPDEPTFFRYAWYYHLKYLAPRTLKANDELLVVAASIGTKKGRAAFRGAIEEVMTQCVPFRVKRTLAFWRDESDFGLQAADYCTWAVMRAWERGDDRSLKLIRDKVYSEYDIFKSGTQTYY